MSIADKKEEAEAVLDSAEMILETISEPYTGKAKELDLKIKKLQNELQDPKDEKALKDLIEEVRELMTEVEEDAMHDDPMMGPGDEMGGGMGPGGPPGGPEEPPF